MTSPSEAVLKSTGEKVIVISSHTAGSTRYVCLLPPQASGHSMRIQEIRGERLQFSGKA